MNTSGTTIVFLLPIVFLSACATPAPETSFTHLYRLPLIGSVVTHPASQTGGYVNGDWEYILRIDPAGPGWPKMQSGQLIYKGKSVSYHQSGAVIETPLGRFISFEAPGGRFVGINDGWFVSALIANGARRSRLVQVFEADGTVNPAILGRWPLIDPGMIKRIGVEHATLIDLTEAEKAMIEFERSLHR